MNSLAASILAFGLARRNSTRGPLIASRASSKKLSKIKSSPVIRNTRQKLPKTSIFSIAQTKPVIDGSGASVGSIETVGDSEGSEDWVGVSDGSLDSVGVSEGSIETVGKFEGSCETVGADVEGSAEFVGEAEGSGEGAGVGSSDG